MKINITCQILLCLMGAHLCAAGQQAADPDDPNHLPREPEAMIRNRVERVTAILARKELDESAKLGQIVKAVTPVVDFELMARLTLEREVWAAMTAEQRKVFCELFIRRLKSFYGQKLLLYGGERIVYQPATVRDNQAQVPIESQGRDDPVKILFKLRRDKEIWKIYDLEIQGVSVIRTYRSQFAEILERGTIGDLIKKLETPVKES